jgi:serine protease Do
MRRVLGLVCLLALPAPAQADDALADLVDQVSGSVVNIYTAGRRQPRTNWEAIFGGPQRWESLGSGFVIDSGPCLIVTNQHVVGPADSIRVRDSKAREYTAEVVGADADIDLAILRIKDCSLPAATLGTTRDLRVGEDVFAVGNPYGHGHTVTRGILSARSRSLGLPKFDLFLQTDAAMNPGNSGGPLFDDAGRVVGVNTRVDGRAEAIGFAIPVELLEGALPALMAGQKVTPGWHGMTLEEQPSGRLAVVDVFAGGPAAAAGILPGDLVDQVDGRDLRGRSGWAESFEIGFPDDRRMLSLLRDRRPVEVTLILTDRAAWTARVVGPRVEVRLFGIEAETLAPDDASALGIDGGVLVWRASRGSLFARGDILIELNGARIRDTADLLRAAKAAETTRALDAVFRRGGANRRLLHNW